MQAHRLVELLGKLETKEQLKNAFHSHYLTTARHVPPLISALISPFHRVIQGDIRVFCCNKKKEIVRKVGLQNQII